MPYRSGIWKINTVKDRTLDSLWRADSIVGEPGCLLVWGANQCGQLGDGTVSPRSSPVQVSGTNWIYIASGDKHAAAIKADGTLWTWGDNTLGQLGDCTCFPRSSPTQIPGSWSSVGAGGQHTLATKSDGTLWSWGSNLYGQLGDNCAAGNIPRSSPVQIPGTNWNKLVGGYYSSYATTITGSLYGWGYNDYGQVGDNTVQPRSSPTQIPGSNWCEIGSGFYHALSIKSDGTMWSWGNNYYGQLGIGTACFSFGGGCTGTSPDRSSPTQVLGSWFKTSGGQSASYASDRNGNLFAWGLNTVGQLVGATSSGANGGCRCIVVAQSSCWKNIMAGGANHVLVFSCCNLLYNGGNNMCGQLGNNSLSSCNGLSQVTAFCTWTSVASFGDSSYGLKC